jgi:hypothetical protein
MNRNRVIEIARVVAKEHGLKLWVTDDDYSPEIMLENKRVFSSAISVTDCRFRDTLESALSMAVKQVKEPKITPAPKRSFDELVEHIEGELRWIEKFPGPCIGRIRQRLQEYKISGTSPDAETTASNGTGEPE